VNKNIFNILVSSKFARKISKSEKLINKKMSFIFNKLGLTNSVGGTSLIRFGNIENKRVLNKIIMESEYNLCKSSSNNNATYSFIESRDAEEFRLFKEDYFKLSKTLKQRVKIIKSKFNKINNIVYVKADLQDIEKNHLNYFMSNF
jgi:hypothetical protein